MRSRQTWLFRLWYLRIVRIQKPRQRTKKVRHKLTAISRLNISFIIIFSVQTIWEHEYKRSDHNLIEIELEKALELSRAENEAKESLLKIVENEEKKSLVRKTEDSSIGGNESSSNELNGFKKLDMSKSPDPPPKPKAHDHDTSMNFAQKVL